MADEITGTQLFGAIPDALIDSLVITGDSAVAVSKKEYDYLVERDKKLSLLETYGVDNWQGYYDAINDVEGYGSE